MTPTGPRITRRRFLQAVGAAGGAAAVLGSMEALRLVAPAGEHRAAVPAAPQVRLRPPGPRQRDARAGPGRRHRRPDDGLRAREGGLRVRDPRSARTTRRPQLDGPRRDDGDRDRRAGPDRVVRRGPVLQRRAGPDPAAPHDARLLPRARRPDRDLRQSERRWLVLQRGGQRRHRAADRTADPPPHRPGRLSRLRQRAPREGHQPGGARRRAERRRRGPHGRVPARPRRARPEDKYVGRRRVADTSFRLGPGCRPAPSTRRRPCPTCSPASSGSTSRSSTNGTRRC